MIQISLSAKIILQTNSLGLSLEDRACLALALSTGYTADKIWSKLDLGCEIKIIS